MIDDASVTKPIFAVDERRRHTEIYCIKPIHLGALVRLDSSHLKLLSQALEGQVWVTSIIHNEDLRTIMVSFKDTNYPEGEPMRSLVTICDAIVKPLYYEDARREEA